MLHPRKQTCASTSSKGQENTAHLHFQKHPIWMHHSLIWQLSKGTTNYRFVKVVWSIVQISIPSSPPPTNRLHLYFTLPWKSAQHNDLAGECCWSPRLITQDEAIPMHLWVLTPARSPNVGNSSVKFVVVDCILANIYYCWWHSGVAGLLQPHSAWDLDAILITGAVSAEFVCSPCDHLDFLWVVRFSPIFQRCAGCRLIASANCP